MPANTPEEIAVFEALTHFRASEETRSAFCIAFDPNTRASSSASPTARPSNPSSTRAASSAQPSSRASTTIPTSPTPSASSSCPPLPRVEARGTSRWTGGRGKDYSSPTPSSSSSDYYTILSRDTASNTIPIAVPTGLVPSQTGVQHSIDIFYTNIGRFPTPNDTKKTIVRVPGGHLHRGAKYDVVVYEDGKFGLDCVERGHRVVFEGSRGMRFERLWIDRGDAVMVFESGPGE